MRSLLGDPNIWWEFNPVCTSLSFVFDPFPPFTLFSFYPFFSLSKRGMNVWELFSIQHLHRVYDHYFLLAILTILCVKFQTFIWDPSLLHVWKLFQVIFFAWLEFSEKNNILFIFLLLGPMRLSLFIICLAICYISVSLPYPKLVSLHYQIQNYAPLFVSITCQACPSLLEASQGHMQH